MNDLEEIENFKKENNVNMAKWLAVNGGLAPMCTLLVKNDDEFKVIIAPIPGEAMESPESKKRFLSIMPKFFDKLEEDGHKVVCFSYSSEAWIRMMDVDDAENVDANGVPHNWQDMKKKEILISSYETATETSVEVNNIIREGKIANEDGKLIDCVRLEKNKEMSDVEEEKGAGSIGGAFANIYRNYLKQKENA